MRTFRPWNSSTPQPLTPVEGFAILARDGRVIPVEPVTVEVELDADGRIALSLEDAERLGLVESRSVARRLAIQRPAVA